MTTQNSQRTESIISNVDQQKAVIMSAVYDRINNVHKKPLHKGQIIVAKDYFIKRKRTIMSQWGRSSGKTEAILFISTVACLLTPGFLVYIIAPEAKQGKEIYWISKRIQNYAPPQFLLKPTGMCLPFKNGSSIIVAGQENYDGLRGIKPNLCIYDEFQNHSQEFHLEVMQPNLIAKNCSLLTFGTPPKSRQKYYVTFWEELQKKLKEDPKTNAYYEFPSSLNPTLDPEELLKIRKTLIESDNLAIWEREYEGKMAFGGQDVVFPKWNPVNHVRTHKVVMSYLQNDKHKLKWYTICDPGTSSCFAVLFACYNPFTQQIFILDEIYEKDRQRTDSRQIWDRIQKKEAELYPNSPPRAWRRIYDEAAAWFQREVVSNFKEPNGLSPSMSPSQKRQNDEESGISTIKMIMTQDNAIIVSDRCYWLRWEIESYITDTKGEYVDSNNHLLDCLRYLIADCNWKLVEKSENNAIIEVNKAYNVLKPEIEEWDQDVVENSLWISQSDIYAEWFD